MTEAGVARWRAVADALERAIASGARVGGDRLPTEAELAERHGVNRHTVRRALAHLAACGLVVARRGAGTFVADAPIPYPLGPRTRFTEALDRLDRPSSGRLLASAIRAARSDEAAALDLAPGAAVLAMRTLRVAGEAGVPTGLALHRLPLDLHTDLHTDAAASPDAALPDVASLPARYAETGSFTSALAAIGVPDYRRRRTEVGAEAADDAMAELLDVAPGAPLLVTRGLDVTPGGQPLQWVETRFPAARVRLTVETD